MSEIVMRNGNVLLVDDEKSICDILAMFLGKRGFTVYQAQSGPAAIEIISSTPIDLVLSDIKMPEMSGVELLKWIKGYNQFLPVIMTTGFPTLDSAIEALKLGAFDYLTKPFHLEEIGEKVRRALLNRQLEEENLLFSKLVSLHEVTKVLSSTHKVDDLNVRFLDYSLRIARADFGALMLYDAEKVLSVAASTPPPDGLMSWDEALFAAAGEWSIGSEEALALKQGDKPPKGSDFPVLPDAVGAYICFPLKAPKRTLGVLNLVRKNAAQPFSNVDLEIINVLSSQASISIENARLYHNIRNNYLKTVRGFALAVEAKDQYTHGHSENVMKFTVVLARKIGLSPQDVEQIKYAGLLHDIGKIGVSEAILNKPGRLSDEEFEEIRKHPELGARIISDVPFLKSLVPLVRHHHEFYNGAGYPDGIAGENIPFGARVLSVADAFEAMTSDRPYRKSLPRTVATDILRKESGTQFDPSIVDAFLAMLDDPPEELCE